jgi:hypothetical protein
MVGMAVETAIERGESYAGIPKKGYGDQLLKLDKIYEEPERGFDPFELKGKDLRNANPLERMITFMARLGYSAENAYKRAIRFATDGDAPTIEELSEKTYSVLRERYGKVADVEYQKLLKIGKAYGNLGKENYRAKANAEMIMFKLLEKDNFDSAYKVARKAKIKQKEIISDLNVFISAGFTELRKDKNMCRKIKKKYMKIRDNYLAGLREKRDEYKTKEYLKNLGLGKLHNEMGIKIKELKENLKESMKLESKRDRYLELTDTYECENYVEFNRCFEEIDGLEKEVGDEVYNGNHKWLENRIYVTKKDLYNIFDRIETITKNNRVKNPRIKKSLKKMAKKYIWGRKLREVAEFYSLAGKKGKAKRIMKNLYRECKRIVEKEEESFFNRNVVLMDGNLKFFSILGDTELLKSYLERERLKDDLDQREADSPSITPSN